HPNLKLKLADHTVVMENLADDFLIRNDHAGLIELYQSRREKLDRHHRASRTPTARMIIAPRTWNPYRMIRSKVISFAVISWLLLSFCFIRSNSSVAGYEKWKTKPRSDYHARIKHLTERETPV